jgi:type VI secretion system protein ImpH
MATPGWTTDPDLGQSPVERLLWQEPYRFEFFQAVRLLQRMFPDRNVVGRFSPAANEVVRFSAHASLPFPASEIQKLERIGDRPPLMTVNFMGLTGPLGMLPLYYTELVVQRVRGRDYTMRDFFDLFNHRMISLFYQAWEKYRFTIAYERDERDRFSHHLLDLIGLGTPGLQHRQAVADDSLLYYSGLLSLHPRSASALRNILMDYFDVPVEIEQFVGAWYPLDENTQTCMVNQNTYSEQLAVGAIVGHEVWDPQSAARIKLGPLTLRQYLEFLPNGSAFEPLKALTKFFSGREWEFEVQLILMKDEVPRCELGSELEEAPQLGWVSWIKSAPFGRNPGDAILRI